MFISNLIIFTDSPVDEYEKSTKQVIDNPEPEVSRDMLDLTNNYDDTPVEDICTAEMDVRF